MVGREIYMCVGKRKLYSVCFLLHALFFLYYFILLKVLFSEVLIMSDTIRTDVILKNIYSHLLNKHYYSIHAVNEKEKKILDTLIKSLDYFRSQCRVKTINSINQSLDDAADVSSSLSLSPYLLSYVFNEIFSSSKTWSRIFAFFIFVGEYAIMDLSKNREKFYNGIYDIFSDLVKNKLENWIEDQGGWESVPIFPTESLIKRFWRKANQMIDKMVTNFAYYNG